MLVASHPDAVHHLTLAEFVEGRVNSPVPIEVGYGSLGVRIFMREGVVWNEIGDAIVIRSSTKSIAVAVIALLLQIKRVWDDMDIKVVNTIASDDDQVIDLDDLSATIEGEVAE